MLCLNLLAGFKELGINGARSQKVWHRLVKAHRAQRPPSYIDPEEAARELLGQSCSSYF